MAGGAEARASRGRAAIQLQSQLEPSSQVRRSQWHCGVSQIAFLFTGEETAQALLSHCTLISVCLDPLNIIAGTLFNKRQPLS